MSLAQDYRNRNTTEFSCSATITVVRIKILEYIKLFRWQSPLQSNPISKAVPVWKYIYTCHVCFTKIHPYPSGLFCILTGGIVMINTLHFNRYSIRQLLYPNLLFEPSYCIGRLGRILKAPTCKIKINGEWKSNSNSKSEEEFFVGTFVFRKSFKKNKTAISHHKWQTYKSTHKIFFLLIFSL